MEHKIGEIITLPDGRKMKVVQAIRSSCYGCDLQSGECFDSPKCSWWKRTDKKSIIYKEIKEK